MSYLNDMLQKLTYNLNQDSTGNISKLFNIVSDELEVINSTFTLIESWRDIDTAEGTTLDNIGKNLGQLRGTLNDEQYRILLKAKIKQSLSKGDINTLIEVVASILNLKFDEVLIQELYPASIRLNVPLSSLNSGIISNPQLIINFIKDTLSAGISLYAQFYGTFEFGSVSNAPEFDNNKGFSDINQLEGGYFGTILS